MLSLWLIMMMIRCVEGDVDLLCLCVYSSSRFNSFRSKPDRAIGTGPSEN
ncbi:hypothetical protein Hanom_Chr07g00637611 [Helianthus anomalus]